MIIHNAPLVSILLPNYNYGKYLKYCLDSILNQTYPNIEILFRDNDSTDDSYEIALSYRGEFEKKGYFYDVSKNSYNMGSLNNAKLISRYANGDYHYYFSSDDIIKPTFIETCMNLFLRYQNLSTVITHREDIDENGNERIDPPFYNKNCIIKGYEQAAVYMMAGIGVPTQCLYNTKKITQSFEKHFRKQFTIAGDWYYNFIYSLAGDVAYVKEALCQYRTHPDNSVNIAELSLLETFEHYLLINEFYSLGKTFEINEVVNRYDKAIEKLGSMCMRYAIKMFHNNLSDIADKYLHLAPVYHPNITKEKIYMELQGCCNLKGEELTEQLKKIENTYTVYRTVAYDPPQGSKEIQL